jgi:hypothetical protein
MTISHTPLRPRRPGRDFRTIGDDQIAATHASLARYFVTAPSARAQSASGADCVDAAAALGPLHAKAMGTTMTLCGLNASSWGKFWDVPFPSSYRSACPRCLAVAVYTGPDPDAEHVAS